MNAGAPVGDIGPALFAAVGILAAVRHAERTGEGQFLDVSMYDGVLAFCERIVYLNSYMGAVPKPEGASNPQLVPFDSFPTRDGWVTIAAPGERHWGYLCDLMGRPELREDDRYRSNADRVARGDEVRSIIRQWTTAHTTSEVVDTLAPLVPCGAVNSIREIAVDPHVARRQMIAEVEHPGMQRPVHIANTPVKMTASPTGVRHRSPLLGEHTRDVLAAAGYAAPEIERLLSSGAVVAAEPARSR